MSMTRRLQELKLEAEVESLINNPAATVEDRVAMRAKVEAAESAALNEIKMAESRTKALYYNLILSLGEVETRMEAK